MSKTFTTAEVSQHKEEANGVWIIIENDVYDITSKSPFLRAPDLWNSASSSLLLFFVNCIAGVAHCLAEVRSSGSVTCYSASRPCLLCAFL